MRDKLSRIFEYIVVIDVSLFVILAPFFSLAAKISIYSSAFFWIVLCFCKYGLRFYRCLIASNVLNKDFRLFFLVVLIATRFSLNFEHSQGLFFERYLGFTLAFLLGSAMAQKRQHVNVLMGVIILVSILIGLGGLWDHVHLSSVDRRLFTSFGQDVNLSAMLALYFPFVSMLALFSRNSFGRWGGLISTFIFCPSFIWNMSRAVWIGVPFSILVIIYTQRKKLALILGIFLGISLLFFPAGLKNRIAQTPRQESRIEMSKAALEMFEDFPVFGVGLGMYEKLVSIYSPEARHLHPDNTFTEILAEMGLIGLTVFLWLFAVFFKNAFSALKSNNDLVMLSFRLGLTAAVFSGLIVSFATNSITVGFQNAVVFWLILGMASGLLPQEKIDSVSNS